MMPRIGSIALFTFLFPLASSGQELGVAGTWELWSIDGLPLADAFPLRVDLAGGVLKLSDSITVSSDELWSEKSIRRGTLELFPDGAFLRTRIVVSTRFMAAGLAERLTGILVTRSDYVRLPQAPDTSRVLGRWRVQADSILLRQTRDQFIATMAAGVRDIFPNASEDLLKQIVSTALEGINLEPLATGRRRGARLILHDLNGRKLIFRRGNRADQQ